jgi:hypothetical protein
MDYGYLKCYVDASFYDAVGGNKFSTYVTIAGDLVLEVLTLFKEDSTQMKVKL